MINMAFYRGLQWLAYHRDQKRLVDVSQRVVEDWRRQVTLNYIKPIVMTMAAKLTQNRPNMTVLPASADESRKHKARVSGRLLEWLWVELDMPRQTFDTIISALLTGQGIWQYYWDENAGYEYELRDPSTGVVLNTVRGGFPRIEDVSPFDFGIDPLATSMENARWVYRVRLVHKQWIKDTFGKNVKSDINRDDLHLRHRSEHRFEVGDSMSELAGDYVRMYELYMDKKYYYATPSQILHSGDWDDEYPFIMIRAAVNPGDIGPGVDAVTGGAAWGETLITDIIGLQRELNLTVSQIAEIKDLTAFPKTWVPLSAEVDVTQFTNKPGALIEWSGQGVPPREVPPPPLPGYLINWPDMIIQKMFDISGVHEISQGASPGSIQSGRGLAILAEMDATKFGPMSRELERAVQKLGKALLRLWKDNARYEVTARVVGAAGRLDIDTFNGSDIDSYDVKVLEGSMFAQSKPLKDDKILQLWQLGIERDPIKIKKVLEFATVEELVGDMSQHRLRARRENFQLSRGVPVAVEPWDEHGTHLDELINMLTAPEWEALDEESQGAGRQHYQEHMAYLAPMIQQQTEAAQSRGMASSGVGGAPELSGARDTSGLDRRQEAFPEMEV